jgi:hypothetical protein
MPKGRPVSQQHAAPYIIIGLAQGFALTLLIFSLMLVGL